VKKVLKPAAILQFVACILLLIAPLSTSAQDPALDAAITQALTSYNETSGSAFSYRELGRTVDLDAGGIIYLELVDHEAGTVIPGIVDWANALRRDPVWDVYLPGNAGYRAAYEQLPATLIARADDTPYRPAADSALLPAEQLADYEFPWEDGQWATVTRSYTEHGIGRIDFDVSGRSVAAAKGGTIIYARDSYDVNAFSTGAWWYWNVVIIEHGPHEYSLYGHLDANSIPQSIKAVCSDDTSRPNCAVPVEAGQVIGREGSTGYSSAYHLHVEFGQNYGIVPYVDTADADADGDRRELIYAGYLYAEQNVAFRGYTPDEVAAWQYGTLEQASHRPLAPLDENIIRNGDFSAGTDQWQPSGQLNWSVQDGVMRVTRLNTSAPPDWASFYQDLDYGVPAKTPFEVTLRLGNASGIAKHVNVSLLNSSGRSYGLITCGFELPPNTPLQLVMMRGKTASTWANVRVEIGVNPPDSSPAALVDDLQVRHISAGDIAAVQCDGLQGD
jgi:murein DD-endopeptidase MepM/ murein hydrolase activator NlpD